jgi:hypothetical protein
MSINTARAVGEEEEEEEEDGLAAPSPLRKNACVRAVEERERTSARGEMRERGGWTRRRRARRPRARREVGIFSLESERDDARAHLVNLVADARRRRRRLPRERVEQLASDLVSALPELHGHDRAGHRPPPRPVLDAPSVWSRRGSNSVVLDSSLMKARCRVVLACRPTIDRGGVPIKKC